MNKSKPIFNDFTSLYTNFPQLFHKFNFIGNFLIVRVLTSYLSFILYIICVVLTQLNYQMFIWLENYIYITSTYKTCWNVKGHFLRNISALYVGNNSTKSMHYNIYGNFLSNVVSGQPKIIMHFEVLPSSMNW